jgi:hypothetical protein
MGQHTGSQAGSKQERYRRKQGQKPRYAEPDELEALINPHHRLTSRQIKFLELVSTGLSHVEAGKQAGVTSTGSRYRCLTNPLAIQYLSSLRAESRAIAAYDVATAMKEAQEDHDFAVTKGNAMAAVKATELRAKLSGLLIDRVEIATVDLTGALTRAQSRVLTHTPQVVGAPLNTGHQPVTTENHGGASG